MFKLKTVLLILGVCLLAYVNSLSHEFTGDSRSLFVGNEFYANPANLSKLFHTDFLMKDADFEPIRLDGQASFSGFISYRPVVALTFFIDNFFWSAQPFGYHLTNLLTHVAVTLLFYIFSFMLMRNQKIALSAALLFSLHPINAEAVNSIGYRSDLIAALFTLISLTAFIKFRAVEKNQRQYYLSLCGVSYFLALFSKESALGIILLFGIYDFCFVPKDKRAMFPYTGLIIILVFYLWIYFTIIPNPHYINPTRIIPKAGQHLATVVNIFYHYLTVFFWPFKITVLPPLYLPHWAGVPLERGIITGIFTLVCIIAVIRSWKHNRIAAYLLSFFLITYLPASNIVPLPNPIAFRFMYIPSMALCLIVSVGINILADWIGPRLLRIEVGPALKILIIGSCAAITISHNNYFKNNLILCHEMIRRYPDSTKPYWILGLTYLDSEDYKKAALYFRQYLAGETSENKASRNNGYRMYLPYVHHYLGKCFGHKPDEAIKEFKNAIILKPDYVFAYIDLAKAYLLKKDFNQCLAYALMSIKMDHQALMGYIFAIHSYAELGQIDEAERLLQKTLKIFPEDDNLKFLKGFIKLKNE